MVAIKKFTGMRGAGPSKKAKRGDPAPGSYGLQINQDGSADVVGVDDQGDQIDISGVATLTATSSDATICAAGPVAGMHIPYLGVAVGSCTVTGSGDRLAGNARGTDDSLDFASAEALGRAKWEPDSGREFLLS